MTYSPFAAAGILKLASRLFFAMCLFTVAICADAASDARQLLNAGKIDEAEARLQQDSATKNDPEANNLLCRVYYSVGQWDAAIKHCERAVQLQPSNARYHLWLGRAYGLKAERSSWFTALRLAGKTRDHFEKAVALDAADSQARSDLAEFYIDAPGIIGGGKDKARKLMSEIENKDPVTAHWILARIAEEEKHFDEAESEYKKEVNSGGDRSQPWLDLAAFYRNRERYDEMESAIQQGLNAKTKHGQLYFEAADNLQRAGRNFPLAIELINKYLKAGSVEDAPAFRAHYVLGLIYQQSGDFASALHEYQTSVSMARNFKEAKDALELMQSK
jgi:tetratricopeptide (TPR) repeat protein